MTGSRVSLAGFPVFISLAKWRFIHLYHHQHTHTVDDPDRAIFARYRLGSKKFLPLTSFVIFGGLYVLSTLKYFIDSPFGIKDFNRRFLGRGRAMKQYRHICRHVRVCAFLECRAFRWTMVLGKRCSRVGFGLYWLVPYCTFTTSCSSVSGVQ